MMIPEGVLLSQPESAPGHPRSGWLDRAARRGLHAQLARLREDRIDVVEGSRVDSFGAGDSEEALHATLTVHDPGLYRALALRGTVGAAESYMDGCWTADDLTTLVRIIARNREILGAMNRGATRVPRVGLRALHALRRNSRTGSRRNIAAHYDLGNDFFALFLDPSWTYSCAIFDDPEASLEEASIAKYDRACKKLELVAEDHVLEIGGGWGGFALHAAGRYGCRVTTITLSREQHELASLRVARAGLAGRVDVRLEDYRHVRGTYDKLASIEMIEAVGHRYFDQFFRICSERLRPRGLMLLQAILTPDQGYETSLRNVDFVKRYIFPGGQLPSLGSIAASMKRATDLRLIHLEDLSTHYARTLAGWHERMLKNLDRIRDLGLPERFIRMWEFYLCYCEGGFAERANTVAQILFEKPRGRREPVLGAL
jgi:cyclopropane-fatty-acyl-phospholipid synthase